MKSINEQHVWDTIQIHTCQIFKSITRIQKYFTDDIVKWIKINFLNMLVPLLRKPI